MTTDAQKQDKDSAPEQGTAGGPRKFFFDMNDFTEGAAIEEEEELPPPPTFSEEELAAAKQEAFAAGKQAGLDEAAASRETQISALIGTISQSFSTLFATEGERATLYETEAVHLARAIFQTLFPALDHQGRLDEISALITKAVGEQNEALEIIITLHPDNIPPLEELFSDLQANLPSGSTFRFQGQDNLGMSDCLLSWKEGGAQRDLSVLKEQIDTYLEQTLAGKARLVDNEETDDNNGIAALDSPETPDEAAPDQEDQTGQEISDE